MPNKLDWRKKLLKTGLLVASVCMLSDSALATNLSVLPDKKPLYVPPSAPKAVDYVPSDTIPVPQPRPWTSEKLFSEKDAELYKRIFAHQAVGNMREADKLIARLTDMRLRGHVLYQRYMHPTSYRSSFEELRNWMVLYPDHPGATKIYKLAMARMPGDATGYVPKPEVYRGIGWAREFSVAKGQNYKSSKKRNTAQRKEVNRLKGIIARDIRRNAPTRALGRLSKDPAAPLLDTVERDKLRAQIAVGYYHAGKIQKAFDVASQSAKRSRDKVPTAGWAAGLSAWRLGRYMSAAEYFEIAGRSDYSSGWMAAAASYWAARSHMRTGNARAVSTWLRKAAEHPRTFYGLIATKALGKRLRFDWDLPTYTKDYHAILNQHEEGRRATALVAAGQVHLAEAELMRIDPSRDAALRQALLAYAGYAGLPGLQMRLANSIAAQDGQIYEAALYPVGPWEPLEGFKIDPLLLNAIMRQESRFDQMAESRSGAMGLMQLMPRTAISMTGNAKKYKNEQAQLEFLDPAVNIELGQRYLTRLMRSKNVQGEIMSLLVAYNAGPGNLHKYKREFGDFNDPLLFIESIPLPETRAYIERVLSNYWIYQMRERQPTPTLEALAAGRPAKYAMAGEYRVASNR